MGTSKEKYKIITSETIWGLEPRMNEAAVEGFVASDGIRTIGGWWYILMVLYVYPEDE